MQRVVLDTNTVVSGLLWSGKPSQIMHAVLQRHLQPIASEGILILTATEMLERI